ncbi:MAG: biotin/lipoyl-binding protein [Woeseiaceae bacterium]|nr:biotin/lipoyl-binding protein [Woeseiaceae bacterium]
MIVFLTLLYVLLLYVLTRTGKVPNTKATWLTIIPYELVLLVGFFIPMQWGAPAGDLAVLTYSVPITPNVAGEVIEVPVEPNEPLRKGDLLFRIDPTQYEAALEGLQAQLKLAELRLLQSRELASQDAGSIYEVQAYEAQVAGLEAQIKNAQWNLEMTEVRAPTDGYVTNVALRPGMRVVNAPSFRAMAFIDTSETGLIVQIHQIYTRNIESGQPAEVTFKSHPGRVFPATVRFLIPVTAQGQVMVTGMAIQPQAAVQPGPFSVRLDLDDPELARELGINPGTVGSAAIYTSEVTVTHIIRKVMIRMDAIMNFIKPA